MRHLYLALHQGTNAAPTAFDASTNDDDPNLRNLSSFPFCNVPDHHSHINNATAIAINPHPPTIPSPTHPPPDTVLNTITPSTGPDLSSFPALTTDDNRVHPLEESSLHDVPDDAPIIGSFHRSLHVNVERRQSATSHSSTQVPTDIPTILRMAYSDLHPLLTPALSTTSIPGRPSDSWSRTRPLHVNSGDFSLTTSGDLFLNQTCHRMTKHSITITILGLLAPQILFIRRRKECTGVFTSWSR
jgi:hypothetical protein